MAWTSHGHHIPGTVLLSFKPKSKARCGGPVICKVCKQDAADYFNPPKDKKD